MITLTCAQCGHDFERHPANERQRKQRGSGGPYCSPGCVADAQRGAARVTLTCIECGETFQRDKYRETERRRNQRKAGPFCGKPCTSRYYAKKNKPWEARQKPLAERFMEKWEYDRGCWRWTASYDGKGYGHIREEGSNSQAHRVGFELFHERRVKDGHELHHCCENRWCVYPLHMEEVTPKEHAAIHAGGKSR